jgi:hypothetical protein
VVIYQVKLLLVAELPVFRHIHAQGIEFRFLGHLARLHHRVVELHEDRIVDSRRRMVLIVFGHLVARQQLVAAPRQLRARCVVALQARAPARLVVKVHGHFD